MGSKGNMGGGSLFDVIEQLNEQAAQQPAAETSSKRTRKKFAGEGFDPELDEVRLTGLQLAVFELMKDGVYRTHSEMKEAIGRGSENGIAAMLRSLRSKEHGHHTVNKRRRGDPKVGLYEYQLVPNPRSKRPHAAQ